jgi:hypothetical protein
MFTRIRPRIVRPLIRRPRGIAVLAVAVVILTNSSAYAQRGGGGCGGMSGGMGGAGGQSLAGGFGGMPGGMGGGFGNPAAMMQMQRMQQGLFNVPSMDGSEEYGDYKAELAARKAYRAAQAEQRKQRLAARQEKLAKYTASRSRSSVAKTAKSE